MFHLVFESHSGRALAPIPKRSTSPRATSNTAVVDSLKALDPKRPIREVDIPRGNLFGGTPLMRGASLSGLALLADARHGAIMIKIIKLS